MSGSSKKLKTTASNRYCK